MGMSAIGNSAWNNLGFGVQNVNGDSKRKYTTLVKKIERNTPWLILKGAHGVQSVLAFVGPDAARISKVFDKWRHTIPAVEILCPPIKVITAPVSFAVQTSDCLAEPVNEQNDLWGGAVLKEIVKKRYYMLAGRASLMLGNVLNAGYILQSWGAMSTQTLASLDLILTTEKVATFALNAPVLCHMPTVVIDKGARAIALHARGVARIASYGKWATVCVVAYCVFFFCAAIQDARNHRRYQAKQSNLRSQWFNSHDRTVIEAKISKEEIKAHQAVWSCVRNAAKFSATYGIFYVGVGPVGIVALSIFAFAAVSYNSSIQEEARAKLDAIKPILDAAKAAEEKAREAKTKTAELK